MAELSDELSEGILRDFLTAYNSRRGTKFSLDHRLAKSDDASCDFHFADPSDGELKVQITTPHGDEDLRKANARDSYFFEKLETGIKQSRIAGVRFVGITLSDAPLPYKREHLDSLVSKLLPIISSKVLAARRSAELSQWDLSARSELLGRYFSNLSVEPGGDPGKPPCLILCPHVATGIPDPVTQVKQSYVRKSDRYRSSAHDLILLIYAGTIPYDADQVGRMRSVLKPNLGHFREVWVFCGADPTGWRVDCIKE